MLALKYLKIEGSQILILIMIYYKNIDYYYGLKPKFIFNKRFTYILKD